MASELREMTIAEELILLLLKDDTGFVAPKPEWRMSCALVGAVLLDLWFKNRIDADLQVLTLLDATPTGDELFGSDPGDHCRRAYPPQPPPLGRTIGTACGGRQRTGLRTPGQIARLSDSVDPPIELHDDLLDLHQADPQLLPETDLEFAVIAP